MAATPINKSEAITIGGIKQWISVKGSNDKNPVLLFLHGGPGNSSMSYADKFTKELQQRFVVVQWDQRGAGKTRIIGAFDIPITVSLMENDAVEIINYLRGRFSQEKIYLMGHSWGGFLGLKVAASHPELLEAYFAVSPMIHQLESERLALGWMTANAKVKKNQVELLELAMVKIPFETGEQLYYDRKWLSTEMGSRAASKAFVLRWATEWLPLFNEASAINFFAIAPEIKCPIYFFVGSNDYQTYFKLTEDYYKALKAEKKDLFWFANSAHTPLLTESQKFQETVLSIAPPKN